MSTQSNQSSNHYQLKTSTFNFILSDEVKHKLWTLTLKIIIIISNFFFVGTIQHLKTQQIVFRPKTLIKANYKRSKLKVLKDTFQQSFKLHNYWELKKTHTRPHTRIRTCKHTHTHIQTKLYIHTSEPIYTQTDKRPLYLKQNLYIGINYN